MLGPLLKKNCPRCATEFFTDNPRRLYCSVNCAVHRRKHPEDRPNWDGWPPESIRMYRLIRDRRDIRLRYNLQILRDEKRNLEASIQTSRLLGTREIAPETIAAYRRVIGDDTAG